MSVIYYYLLSGMMEVLLCVVEIAKQHPVLTISIIGLVIASIMS